jgi:hypothetical protein
MKFLSIFSSTPKEGPPSPELIAKMGALIETGTKEVWLIATEGVQAPQAGFRVQSRRGRTTVVDGPFAEAKEVLGGYALIQAASRDAMIELTKRFLEVAGDGTCEIYELFVPPGS